VRFGVITIGASMQEVFVFNEIAVIIRHWYEIGEHGREHGARVEIRRLTPSPRRGSESASQRITIDEPIWRADLFDLLGDEPGTFGRAHYHHKFDGVEPTARDWAAELSADPLSWCRDQLSNLEELIPAAGATLQNIALEAQELQDACDRMIASVARCVGKNCPDPERCRAETRDAAATIALMEGLYGGGVPAFEST
jgi:hypothetical protein